MVAILCLTTAGLIIYLVMLVKGQSGGTPLIGGAPFLEERAGGSPAEGFWVKVLALPLAFGLGGLLKDVWWAVGFPFHVMCHELGHSSVAWLRGCWSLPVVAGFALVSYEQSWLLMAIIAALIGWGAWTAFHNRDYPLLVGCAVLWAGQAFFSFFLDHKAWLEWFHFGGCAAEFVLPALLIGAVHLPFRERSWWSFLRYPLLACAACSLVYAQNFWSLAASDPEHYTVWGSADSLARNPDEDISKLIRGYGWTPGRVADRYLAIGKVCFGGVGVVYLWGLGAALRKPREDGPSDPPPEDELG